MHIRVLTCAHKIHCIFFEGAGTGRIYNACQNLLHYYNTCELPVFQIYNKILVTHKAKTSMAIRMYIAKINGGGGFIFYIMQFKRIFINM